MTRETRSDVGWIGWPRVGVGVIAGGVLSRLDRIRWVGYKTRLYSRLCRSFKRIAVECGFRFDSLNTISVGIAIMWA